MPSKSWPRSTQPTRIHRASDPSLGPVLPLAENIPGVRGQSPRLGAARSAAQSLNAARDAGEWQMPEALHLRESRDWRGQPGVQAGPQDRVTPALKSAIRRCGPRPLRGSGTGARCGNSCDIHVEACRGSTCPSFAPARTKAAGHSAAKRRFHCHSQVWIRLAARAAGSMSGSSCSGTSSGDAPPDVIRLPAHWALTQSLRDQWVISGAVL